MLKPPRLLHTRTFANLPGYLPLNLSREKLIDLVARVAFERFDATEDEQTITSLQSRTNAGVCFNRKQRIA